MMMSVEEPKQEDCWVASTLTTDADTCLLSLDFLKPPKIDSLRGGIQVNDSVNTISISP